MSDLGEISTRIYAKYPNDQDIWELLQGVLALANHVRRVEQKVDTMMRLIEIGRSS